MKEPYRRPMSSTWWMSNPNYKLFMVREATAIFVGAFLVVFLLFLRNLAKGPDAYQAFVHGLSSPLWIVFHVIVLAMAMYHSITWFNLTPKAVVVRMGEDKVPPVFLIGPNYAGWLGISLLILWIVLG
jgi:fumarate reductase subunit C